MNVLNRLPGIRLVLLMAAVSCAAGPQQAKTLQDREEGGERHAAMARDLDPEVIEEAAGTAATLSPDGVVRIGWARQDVEVAVDGMAFPPAAGLGSWAAFHALEDGAMVMGDTVVFRDEVDAAIDAAFEHGLEVTALHNHFFYDEPKVYFMHIGGRGEPAALARGVGAMWDAIKKVRREAPDPADRFEGPIPKTGEGALDPQPIERITGLKPAARPGGVVKISTGREARMHGAGFGKSMGLSTWAAFSGTDAWAAMDGDFAMTAREVQPVLRALRRSGIHVVALHNHMIGEEPAYYFVHFWAKGATEDLARGFKSAMDAQKAAGAAGDSSHSARWSFDDTRVGELPAGWKVEGTNQRGPTATWGVKPDESAPSQPNVLALTDTKQGSGGTFNLCWTDRLQFDDGAIEVKVKAGSGRIDQGGGPIWRARDEDNYYIARWNPLEDNFRLYYVKGGRRVQLDSAEVDADPAEWHTIRIEQEGDEIECSLDGQKLLEARDDTFPSAGGVGVWTKADAASSFDDLIVDRRGHGAEKE